MVPVTGGANRKWGFTGKVETRSYERLVDALIDFVETGDGLKERFLAGFTACLAADRKSVENRGFGVAVWLVATTGSMPMTDSGWLHYRDLKSRCPVCKRPAHIAKRDGDFYFVDDEYNPFVRHAPVKTMGSSTTRKTVIRRSTVTWIR